MRLLISQYGRMFLTCICALASIAIVFSGVFSSEMGEATGLSENQIEEGVEANYELQGYTFELNTDSIPKEDENVLKVCVKDKINYSQYVNAYLNDGTDIKNYVSTSGVKNVNIPGNYEVTYYLNYEGETDSKTLKVTVQDKTSNLECPAFDTDSYDEISCVFNSDCPSNYECKAKTLTDEDGNEIEPTDEQQKELNKNKVCVVKTKVCETDDDCTSDEYCNLVEDKETKKVSGTCRAYKVGCEKDDDCLDNETCLLSEEDNKNYCVVNQNNKEVEENQ